MGERRSASAALRNRSVCLFRLWRTHPVGSNVGLLLIVYHTNIDIYTEIVIRISMCTISREISNSHPSAGRISAQLCAQGDRKESGREDVKDKDSFVREKIFPIISIIVPYIWGKFGLLNNFPQI